MRKVKISLLISAVSVIICLAGIIVAVMNLRYSAVNGTPTGSALTVFLCIIAILCSNLTLFIININKYKTGRKDKKKR